MPLDPFFQYNNQGAAILNDAGIRLNQLSPGSYNNMLGALENGNSFSFQKNSGGLFDVVTDQPKDFWGNLFGGTSKDFLGDLFGSNKKESESVIPTAQDSFWNHLVKFGANIAALGPIAGLAASAPDLAAKTVDDKKEEMTKNFIRVGLFLAGLVLIAIGIVYLLREPLTDVAGEVIKKAV